MTQNELDELYLAALAIEEAGDYDRALTMLRRGAECGDCAACNAIGIAYDAGRGVAQDKTRAIEWFKRAWAEGENPEYVSNIALTCDEIGLVDEAESWWRRAVDASNKSAHLGYAEFLLGHARYDEIARIRELIEVAARAEARVEVSEDEKAAAQRLLDGLRAAQTPDAIAEVWRAYEANRMFEIGGPRAVAYFENLAAADAENKSARCFLMLLAIDERDLRRALAYAREVENLSPREPNLNLNIGRIYELAGTYDKAIAFYKREVALYPNNESAYFHLGTTFFKRKKWSKAIFYFEKAASFGAGWRQESLSRLASLHEKTGALEKERQIYREMVASDPTWAVPLQNLGATYIDTRDYARALEILRRAKSLDESDAMIDRNLAHAARGLAKRA